MENHGKSILSLLIVGAMIMSGVMALPSTVVAKNSNQIQGTADLVVEAFNWRFPIVTGEELPVTIYVKNIGTAPVDAGFEIQVDYAELSGFWQQPTETFYIWVEPPIGVGEIKAVEFTTTALNTYQANFEAQLDSLDNIVELDENNNYRHICLISVEAAPGSILSVPVYARNVNLYMGDIFTIAADETRIPDNWDMSGGLPPSNVPASPGANVALSEIITVPLDTTINPVFRINATRQSDGEAQSTFIEFLTTPEMGFSFSPFLNEFTVMGADSIDSETIVTSEVISQQGPLSLTKYTVTNSRGQYTSATIRMISTNHLNMFEITEIDYNGVETIIPEENFFMTTFLVKNGELKHFNQYMRYNPDLYVIASYDRKTDTSTMTGAENGEQFKTTFDGFDAMGTRVFDAHLASIRLDTSDPNVPLCPNVNCWTMDSCFKVIC